MTTWLYCLLSPPRPDLLPAGATGLGGTPVRLLATGGIEAWVSSVAARVDADLEGARTHNQVVEVAMSTGRTPLPARFGQRFADDAACLADIARRHAALDAALHRVDGAVEMGVLLVGASASPMARSERPDVAATATSQPGHRYLETLRARAADDERWRAQVVEQLLAVDESVRALVRASSPAEVGHGRVAGSMAHLVTGQGVSAYRTAAARASLAPGFRVVVVGPRAPYSFCAVEEDVGTILAT